MNIQKIDIKKLDKKRFSLDVVSYLLPVFDYNTLSTYIDKNGEVQVHEVKGENINVNQSTFLFWLRTDKKTGIDLIEGINDVNSFLMDLLVNKSLLDVSIYSRGLIHYFSKLAEWQLDWYDMPYIQSRKPTYRFKRFLEESYRSSDKDMHIAASTGKAYMRAVITFYKFYIRKGIRFDNKPFEFETISQEIESDETYMQQKRTIIVQTTDLRLKVPKSAAGIIPQRLRALTDHEWKILDHILRIERKVLKSEHGKLIKCSLPIEFTLIFLLMRHCGLRREEALTFNEELLIRLVSNIDLQLVVSVEIGPMQGIATKNDKPREIEIPANLVRVLHKYSLSPRYIKRRDLFFDNCTKDSRTPLFLNQTGNLFPIATINARWSEIRNYMQHKLGSSFTHKPHNLRPTFAVKRLFSLIDAGMTQSLALEHIQTILGHENLVDTFHYLTQIEGNKSPEELAEIALDHLYEIADMDIYN
jgi:site-specific recombinase XerD